MKRRWRRFILTAVTALLVLCLIGVGVAVWLHQSGRLAGLSEDLIERLSDVLQPYLTGDRAWARPFEIAAALNRLRTLYVG